MSTPKLPDHSEGEKGLRPEMSEAEPEFLGQPMTEEKAGELLSRSAQKAKRTIVPKPAEIPDLTAAAPGGAPAEAPAPDEHQGVTSVVSDGSIPATEEASGEAADAESEGTDEALIPGPDAAPGGAPVEAGTATPGENSAPQEINFQEIFNNADSSEKIAENLAIILNDSIHSTDKDKLESMPTLLVEVIKQIKNRKDKDAILTGLSDHLQNRILFSCIQIGLSTDGRRNEHRIATLNALSSPTQAEITILNYLATQHSHIFGIPSFTEAKLADISSEYNKLTELKKRVAPDIEISDFAITAEAHKKRWQKDGRLLERLPEDMTDIEKFSAQIVLELEGYYLEENGDIINNNALRNIEELFADDKFDSATTFIINANSSGDFNHATRYKADQILINQLKDKKENIGSVAKKLRDAYPATAGTLVYNAYYETIITLIEDPNSLTDHINTLFTTLVDKNRQQTFINMLTELEDEDIINALHELQLIKNIDDRQRGQNVPAPSLDDDGPTPAELQKSEEIDLEEWETLLEKLGQEKQDNAKALMKKRVDSAAINDAKRKILEIERISEARRTDAQRKELEDAKRILSITETPTSFNQKTQSLIRRDVQSMNIDLAEMNPTRRAQLRNELIGKYREMIDTEFPDAEEKIRMLVNAVDQALAIATPQDIDKAKETALKAIREARKLGLEDADIQKHIDAALTESGQWALIGNSELTMNEIQRELNSRRREDMVRTINQAIIKADRSFGAPGVTRLELDEARKEAEKALEALGYSPNTDTVDRNQFVELFNQLANIESTKNTTVSPRVEFMGKLAQEVISKINTEGSPATRYIELLEIKDKLAELGFKDSEINDYLRTNYPEEYKESAERKDLFGHASRETLLETLKIQQQKEDLKELIEDQERDRFTLRLELLKTRLKKWGNKLKLIGKIGFTSALIGSGLGTSLGIVGIPLGIGSIRLGAIFGVSGLLLFRKLNNEYIRSLNKDIRSREKSLKELSRKVTNKDKILTFFNDAYIYNQTGELPADKDPMTEALFESFGIRRGERNLNYGSFMGMIERNISILGQIENALIENMKQRGYSISTQTRNMYGFSS